MFGPKAFKNFPTPCWTSRWRIRVQDVISLRRLAPRATLRQKQRSVNPLGTLAQVAEQYGPIAHGTWVRLGERAEQLLESCAAANARQAYRRG